MNRLSTAVLVISCLLGGYALAGTRVSAADDAARRFPAVVEVGNRVTVLFDGGETHSGSANIESLTTYLPRFDCTIAEVSNGWFRCALANDTFNPPREQAWYDINHVAALTKPLK
jgi:hypothetical protein